MTALRFCWIALVLVTAACASGRNPYKDLADAARDVVFTQPPSTTATGSLTRAQLDQIPSAVIGVGFSAGQRAFLVPQANSGGYLTYLDAARRGLVIFGGAVSGTDGLGQDLLGVRHDAGDPIAHPRPLQLWPGQIDRSYQYRLRDGAPFSITVTCVLDVAARETIEIVERSYETARIIESCASPRRRFQNTYWVAPETGQIWKSQQWLGPRLNPVTIEVIRPHRAG